MPRRRGGFEAEEEERGSGGGGRKRRRSIVIDNAAEKEEEEEEDDEDDDEDFGHNRRGSRHGPRERPGSQFIELEVDVARDDEEEEEEEGEADFIDDGGAEVQDEDEGRRMHRRPLLSPEDDEEDSDALERIIQRYAGSSLYEDNEEEIVKMTTVEQQALLPSVKDTKLWMVKCAIGHEREAAVCLMQKCIDRGPEILIRSAVALDHLKSYIYVEADKEAHVREACEGLRHIYSAKLLLVPIKEMTDVLSVETKAIDLPPDTWVRMKNGTYRGDLAKVVEFDNVRQRATVKLIPRIDLQALANKPEGREVVKKAFVPPPRFMNTDEAREMHIRVERRRDRGTGDYFDCIGSMMFKEGFLYKSVSMKSITSQNIQPTFDELEKFQKPGDGYSDVATFSDSSANWKKTHFMKGDAVIFIKGDLKNLMGWVEKVEEDNVHIRPNMKGLPVTLVNKKELCKYFKPGDHVKVVSGEQAGATGMVVKVEGHVLILVSDTTKEDIRVLADHVVESSEVTSGVTKIGDYEMHDLVLLDNNSFGVIIRVESEAFLVLKGVADKPDVALVKLREIKCKLERKGNAQDRDKNTVSVKDVVTILDGPCKGKQGTVEHIHRGILFISDCHHLGHASYVCAKSQSCIVVGGSRTTGNRNGDRFPFLQAASRMASSAAGGRDRGARGGHDSLRGNTVKIRLGAWKGYRGRVVDVKGQSVRIELESQMKIVTVPRDQISDNVTVSTSIRDPPRCVMGSETPMHPSRTPLHPYMTPTRDPGATPIHDGMRTLMHDRAWNPYAPMSPARIV